MIINKQSLSQIDIVGSCCIYQSRKLLCGWFTINTRLFSSLSPPPPSPSLIDSNNYKILNGLPFPSDEQKRIVNAACLKDCNIQVNAVAGSGKTTTILHIAGAYQQLNGAKDTPSSILVLQYNEKLKTETRNKQKKFKCNNLDVHNYHSFIQHYYNESGKDSKGMKLVIKTMKPPAKLFSYELIIIDEIQDMTPDFFKLLCKIMCDNLQKECRIIVLGMSSSLPSSSLPSSSLLSSSSSSLLSSSIIIIINTSSSLLYYNSVNLI
jgi:hypothetical protein